MSLLRSARVVLCMLLLGILLLESFAIVNAPQLRIHPSTAITQFDIDGDGVMEYVSDNRNLINATTPDGYETYTDPDNNSFLLRYADGNGDGNVDLIIEIKPQLGRVAPNTLMYWDPVDGIIRPFIPYDLHHDGRTEYLLDLNQDGVPDLAFDWDQNTVPYTHVWGTRNGYYSAAEWDFDFNTDSYLWAVNRSLALGLNVLQVYALTYTGPNNPGSTNNQKRWDYYGWFDATLGNPTASANFRAFVTFAHSRGLAVFLSSSYATYDPWWYTAHTDGRDMNHEMRRNAAYNATVQAGAGGTYSMPGTSFVNNSYYVSPFDPAFRAWKTSLFRNLVQNYSVDGFKMDDRYTFENPYWSWETWMAGGDTRNLWDWHITDAYRKIYGVDPSWNNATGWAEANSTTWFNFRVQIWQQFLGGIWRGAGLNESDMVFGYGDVPVGGNSWRPTGSLNMEARVYTPENSSFPDAVTGRLRFGVCYRTKPGFELSNPSDIDLYGPQSWDDSGKWYYWFDSGDPAPGSPKWYAVSRSSMPYWYTLRPLTAAERAPFVHPPTTPQPLPTGDADYSTVTLRWLPSSDSAGDAIAYEVQVAWSNVLGTGQFNLATSNTSASFDTTNQTTYVWAVRASNGFQYSNWSAFVVFRDTGTTPPEPHPTLFPWVPSANASFLTDWLFWLMMAVSIAIVRFSAAAIRKKSRDSSDEDVQTDNPEEMVLREDPPQETPVERVPVAFECSHCYTPVGAGETVCPTCGSVFGSE
jgi:hypothetical protein